MTAATDPTASGRSPELASKGRKARYGVAYLRAVCAQAGAPLNETSPDEDVSAVDCSILFDVGTARVQVKCTSGKSIQGKTATVRLEQQWIKKWNASHEPVYLVLVIVGKEEASWLRHDSDGTFHSSAAFWVRVDNRTNGAKLQVPKTQRLTSAAS